MACAVCATPVNNKEAPLARKYGVIACEVCRKFISRVTKISKLSTAQSSTQQLQCKGSTDGKCGNCDSLCVPSNSVILFSPRWQLQHTLAQEPIEELQEALQRTLHSVLAQEVSIGSASAHGAQKSHEWHLTC